MTKRRPACAHDERAEHRSGAGCQAALPATCPASGVGDGPGGKFCGACRTDLGTAVAASALLDEPGS